MRRIIFELCAETLQACLIAKQGGADRIELCTALDLEGLTPSHGLIRQAVLRSALPVHVLLRPRAGNFVYTDEEMQVMREDLLHARMLGASGFIVGILHPDKAVDIERTRSLVALAHPLEVTFHRAFDSTSPLDQALEDVIQTGCKRLLTSGGAKDVVAGANSLASLVKQAAGRIEIVVGGGLRVAEAGRVARITGATHFHGSLRHQEAQSYAANQVQQLGSVNSNDTSAGEIDPAHLQAMLHNLRTSEAEQ